MTAYYNENDPKAAAWLRELIRAGLIADGVVDERSIVDVRADDLAGFAQCHFFAGIGGWSYALRLAGWADERPVWTGSCPCQPFSQAGKHKGAADERHLWPEFARLIRECAPPVVFGEQVASRAGLEWLAGVRADMEGAGYAVGAADLCAAGVGAPHIRQRLYWVANAGRAGDERRGIGSREVRSAHPTDAGQVAQRERRGTDSRHGCVVGGMVDADARRLPIERLAEHGLAGEAGLQPDGSGAGRPWDRAVLIPCGDGKARRIEPGLEPLAHGISGRVGLLRGYGNAIVPQVAQAFIEAYLYTEQSKE